MSLKEKCACSTRNDAERASDRGCASIAGTKADTDDYSLGSVLAEFSALQDTFLLAAPSAS